MFGSPETTTGGKALKFYASVRMDIRRIEALKTVRRGRQPHPGQGGQEQDGPRPSSRPIRHHLRSRHLREGSLIDVGVEQGLVRKAGAWYTYDGEQLGQGKENVRTFLRENPDIADEIEKRIKEKLGGRCTHRSGRGSAAPVDF